MIEREYMDNCLATKVWVANYNITPISNSGPCHPMNTSYLTRPTDQIARFAMSKGERTTKLWLTIALIAVVIVVDIYIVIAWMHMPAGGRGNMNILNSILMIASLFIIVSFIKNAFTCADNYFEVDLPTRQYMQQESNPTPWRGGLMSSLKLSLSVANLTGSLEEEADGIGLLRYRSRYGITYILVVAWKNANHPAARLGIGSQSQGMYAMQDQAAELLRLPALGILK